VVTNKLGVKEIFEKIINISKVLIKLFTIKVAKSILEL